MITFSSDLGSAYKNFILSFDFGKEEFGKDCLPFNMFLQLAVEELLYMIGRNSWDKDYSIHIKLSPSMIKKISYSSLSHGYSARSVVSSLEHGIYFKGYYPKFESIVFFFELNWGNIRIVQVQISNGNCNVMPGKMGREATLQGKTVFAIKYLATEVGFRPQGYRTYGMFYLFLLLFVCVYFTLVDCALALQVEAT
ncbi:hypothetical protein ACFXTI_023683 [Malus domestica]